MYLRETAVPIGRYLNEIKNRLMDISPNTALMDNSFFWLPRIGILFFKRYVVAKANEVIDLKNTN